MMTIITGKMTVRKGEGIKIKKLELIDVKIHLPEIHLPDEPRLKHTIWFFVVLFLFVLLIVLMEIFHT